MYFILSACKRSEYVNNEKKICIPCPDNSHTTNYTATSSEDCICNEGYVGSPIDGVACEGNNYISDMLNLLISVSKWLVFNGTWVSFQLCHGDNSFDENSLQHCTRPTLMDGWLYWLVSIGNEGAWDHKISLSPTLFVEEIVPCQMIDCSITFICVRVLILTLFLRFSSYILWYFFHYIL